MAATSKNDGLQGALSLLILKTVAHRALHGYAIASQIQRISDDLLRVEEGSLYPALHRLEQEGLIQSEWGLTETNRKARFYQITSAGQKRLDQELDSYRRIQRGISLVLGEA
ncbi:PadR family transcriptional regulator [Bryobacterales bacterium F-183]|nr:PadR family transcriptional regulator [Bryobacterales bacterium F-183]